MTPTKQSTSVWHGGCIGWETMTWNLTTSPKPSIGFTNPRCKTVKAVYLEMCILRGIPEAAEYTPEQKLAWSETQAKEAREGDRQELVPECLRFIAGRADDGPVYYDEIKKFMKMKNVTSTVENMSKILHETQIVDWDDRRVPYKLSEFQEYYESDACKMFLHSSSLVEQR